MNFGQSIATCFTKYADFGGRASRPEFWWFFLFCVLAGAIADTMNHALGGVFHLAVLLPSLAVGARRLHDTNRTAWLLFLILVPVIGWIILIVFYCGEPVEPNQYGSAEK